MHIGMRTVKTAVGTAAAMLIAYELHLEYWDGRWDYYDFISPEYDQGIISASRVSLIGDRVRFCDCDRCIFGAGVQCTGFRAFLTHFHSFDQRVCGAERYRHDRSASHSFYDGEKLQLVLD